MQYQGKRLGQIFFIVTLVTIIALLSMVIISTNVAKVIAQEPAVDSTPGVPISEETLATFGLSASFIEAVANASFDLEVNKTANVATITSGEFVTYTITITISKMFTVERDIIHPNQMNITTIIPRHSNQT